MPICIEEKGQSWVVAYRGHVVAEAASEAEARRLALRAVERLLLKLN